MDKEEAESGSTRDRLLAMANAEVECAEKAYRRWHSDRRLRRLLIAMAERDAIKEFCTEDDIMEFLEKNK